MIIPTQEGSSLINYKSQNQVLKIWKKAYLINLGHVLLLKNRAFLEIKV
jgi:hypothetical protein